MYKNSFNGWSFSQLLISVGEKPIDRKNLYTSICSMSMRKIWRLFPVASCHLIDFITVGSLLVGNQQRQEDKRYVN